MRVSKKEGVRFVLNNCRVENNVRNTVNNNSARTSIMTTICIMQSKRETTTIQQNASIEIKPVTPFKCMHKINCVLNIFD